MANLEQILSSKPVEPQNLTGTRKILRNPMNPKNCNSFKPAKPEPEVNLQSQTGLNPELEEF